MSDTFGKDMLVGRVALVTGASRGIGKGVATVLVQAGAKVYITGRFHPSDSIQKMTVLETAEELNKMGPGRCIGIYCDHRNDEEVKSLFTKIEAEDKQLDILVNNVFGALDMKKSFSDKCFWNADPTYIWDLAINAGLRAHYVASCLAIKIMIPQKSGLIVNISSEGGCKSLFTPVYGIGKEGTDRMAVEFGSALKEYNICSVSLWPGAAKTETMKLIHDSPNSKLLKKIWHVMEDVTLTGKAVVSIFNDPNRMKLTGRVHMVACLSHYYGFKDVNGIWPYIPLSLRYFVSIFSPTIGEYIPSFIRLPLIILALMTSKF